ncbi:MAG: SGNH/GDSL hydrolase family protein [Nostocoides sp.]
MTGTWHRYVAIGDSFTEGLSDADPEREDSFVGWADYLATALDERPGADLQYANLAVRGRMLADVVGEQLDTALAMSPDLVSMVGGGNDLLRPSVDLDALATSLETAVVRIRATGADVLLATPTDTKEAGIFRALRSRHAVHSANLFTIAQDQGCHVVNLWGMRALRDWRMWSEDRIHLTTAGHQRVALAALHALDIPVEDQSWRDRLPPAPPTSRRQQLQETGGWAREHMAPWIQRRLTGDSSGRLIQPKRPVLEPVRPPSQP